MISNFTIAKLLEYVVTGVICMGEVLVAGLLVNGAFVDWRAAGSEGHNTITVIRSDQ